MEICAMATRKFVLYRGEKFWLQTTGRYFQSGRKDAKERLLHRRIWTDRRGPIPAGYVVHHKDGDWTNNSIGNLELVLGSEHARHHKRERLAKPGGAEENREWLDRARVAAAQWHRSDAGVAWHVEHGKRTWAKRNAVTCKCERCGASFKSFWPDKARFCSSACAQSVYFRGYFTEERKCAWCGKPFMANRHRKTACCSRACGAAKGHADRRL